MNELSESLQYYRDEGLLVETVRQSKYSAASADVPPAWCIFYDILYYRETVRT